MDRSICCSLWLLSVCASGMTSTAVNAGPAGVAVTVTRDGTQPRYSLAATEASLGEIAPAVARATGCQVEVENELPKRRLTIRLTRRSAERLYHGLARHAALRLTVRYRLEPPGAGGSRQASRWVFAREPVELEVREPRPVREVVGELGPPVELQEGVSGRVSLVSMGRPLGEVLDSIARQARCRWVTVIRFEARKSVDPEAAEQDRMHEHLAELAALTSEERQDEIEDELRRLEGLVESERAAGLERMAQDVLSLGTLLKRVPGEHRGNVAPTVLAVARDYWAVLARLGSSRRASLRPIITAVDDLEKHLRNLR